MIDIMPLVTYAHKSDPSGQRFAQYQGDRLPDWAVNIENEPTPTIERKSPKIIQLILTPNDQQWQGHLIGLADDGNIYAIVNDKWILYFEGNFETQKEN